MLKPAVSKLRERGVEIRSIDVSADDIVKLQEAFQGIDTVIVTLIFTEIDTQPKLADAAKLAGVKRFITDDWGTACVPGVMKLYDKVRRGFPARCVFDRISDKGRFEQKLQIREYVKSIGLGYTFIDVGYW